NVVGVAGFNEGTLEMAGIVGLNFIDYDHDGDLDLYTANGISIPGGATPAGELFTGRGFSTIWRNNGNGSFTEVNIGVSLPFMPSNSVGTDYNNDRAVDLAVADGVGGTIFQNPREGTFTAIH